MALCAGLLITVLLTACGGVNASGGASPSTFLIPGLVGHDVDGQDPRPRVPVTHDSAETDPNLDAASKV